MSPHEMTQQALGAADHPPAAVLEFNEGAFERAARAAYGKLGPAAPWTLNQMLVEFGF